MEGKAEGRSLKDVIGIVTAVFAVIAGVFYLAMSALSVWVYAPVHLSPRDLGLSSSSIVVLASMGLVTCMVVAVVAGGVLGGLAGALGLSRDPEMKELIKNTPLPFESDDEVSNAAAVAELRRRGLSQEQAEQAVKEFHRHAIKSVDELLASSGVDIPEDVRVELANNISRAVPRARLQGDVFQKFALMGACVGILLTLLGCLVALVHIASRCREAIQAGTAPALILGFVPPPWSATLADVTPASGAIRDAAAPLPKCALFLGQNDSTVFLREESGQTIRLPAATVRLILHDRNRC